MAPPLGLRSYFDQHDFDSLCHDIALLTHFLNGYRHGGSLSIPKKSPSRRFFEHIVTVIDNSDTDSAGIAVTAHVSCERAVSVIFAPSTPEAPDREDNNAVQDASGTELGVDIIHIAARGRRAAVTLLSNGWSAKPVPFNQHLSEIVTIINLCASNAPSPDLFSPADGEFARIYATLSIILRRTYMKHGARVLKRREIWRECPIVLMQDWYNNQDMVTLGLEASTIHLKMIGETLTELLTKHGIFPLTLSPGTAGVEGAYELNAGNVKGWLCVFSEVLSMLEGLLTRVSSNGDRKPFRKSPRVTRHYKKVRNATMALHALLRSGVLDIIINTRLASYLSTKYAQGSLRREPESEVELTSVSSAKSSEAKDELETELMDVDEPDDDKIKNDITKLVYQVLETLTLTYRAAVAAIQHRTATPTPIPYPYGLAAYKFVLKPPALNVSEEAVEELKTKFLDTFATGTSPHHREAAIAFFERANVQASSVNSSHVHAEASLMGVSCASLSKGGSRPENSPALEQVAKLLSPDRSGDIEVGVNKRCCFCCSMLADFLAKQRGDTIYPTFTFHSTFDLPEPGTHTTIQPWAAPHIGIPLDALREMRTQLLEVLYHAAFPGLSSTDTDSLSDAPDYPLTADGIAEQDLQIAAMLQRSNLED